MILVAVLMVDLVVELVETMELEDFQDLHLKNGRMLQRVLPNCLEARLKYPQSHQTLMNHGNLQLH